MPLRLLTRKPAKKEDNFRDEQRAASSAQVAAGEYQPADAIRLEEDELRRLYQLRRYSVIVANRARWADKPGADDIIGKASGALDDAFAMVPEGYASIPQTIHDDPGCPEVDVETTPYLLSRYAVTNDEFQLFVDGGGYEQLDLWPEDIWPHLIDFKDQSENQGPKYWEGGRHDKRLARHPVVGICYYEAAACARWFGCRLPTEAEWQMAASWRIRSSAHVLRRYPWGDALDKRRCNIWASAIGGTVPVESYEGGAAPNGVVQLTGNTWEWTSSDFDVVDEEGRPIVGDMLMKSIRGGAFDTYFASQATASFRTGLATLLRSHNVGFRLALDLND